MTTSNVEDNTGLPKELTLTDVFSQIKLAPTDVAALLSAWAASFMGGPQHGIGAALRDHAAKVASPDTYKPDQQTGFDTVQTAPAAQGQATTPATLATPLATPSQIQPPAAPVAPELTPAPLDAEATPTPSEPAWMQAARDAGWQPASDVAPLA